MHEKQQTKQNGKEKLKIEKLKTPPKINSLLRLSIQALPLDRHYHISSLNHPISKEFNQLCAHTLPLWQ
jgi:hypothetical protein